VKVDSSSSAYHLNIQSNIKEIREAREKINAGLLERTNHQAHTKAHKIEKALEAQRLAEIYGYGKALQNKSEGTIVDIEV
jgi:HPt (histidine-containing phosphotransfer) domain-containing protein